MYINSTKEDMFIFINSSFIVQHTLENIDYACVHGKSSIKYAITSIQA